MKMTRLEKRFVNRDRKTQRNVASVRKTLEALGNPSVADALEIGCGTGAVAAYLANAYLIWSDLVAPGFLRILLKPWIKNYAVYRADEVRFVFAEAGLVKREVEQSRHGPLLHHQMVLQKEP